MNELAIYMPTGKVAKQQLEQKIKNMYLSGDTDPLELEIGIKGVEEAIKTIRKDPEVRGAVMNALSLYNEKTVQLQGAMVTKKNTAAQYDYSVCGDPEYNRMAEQMMQLKDSMKERQNFLQTLKRMTAVVDQDTGEVVEINPPAKEQGETYAIKFI